MKKTTLCLTLTLAMITLAGCSNKNNTTKNSTVTSAPVAVVAKDAPKPSFTQKIRNLFGSKKNEATSADTSQSTTQMTENSIVAPASVTVVAKAKDAPKPSFTQKIRNLFGSKKTEAASVDISQSTTQSGVTTNSTELPSAPRSDTETALMHHNFILTHVNGKPIKDPSLKQYLEFSENLHFSGRFCNAFSGQAELVNGVLRKKDLRMTSMACGDKELSQAEYILQRLLNGGTQVIRAGDKLTLSSKRHKLEFTLRDWVY